MYVTIPVYLTKDPWDRRLRLLNLATIGKADLVYLIDGILSRKKIELTIHMHEKFVDKWNKQMSWYDFIFNYVASVVMNASKV